MPDMNLGDAMLMNGPWVETLTLRREDSVTNDDGYAKENESTTEEIQALVRSAEGREWGVITEGRAGENEEYFMIVKNDDGVEDNDEVKYHGDWYRAVEPAKDFEDGFTVFSLLPNDA